MSKTTTKSPDADGPPRKPQTYTSPPMVGSSDIWARVEAEVDAVPAADALTPRVDLQAAGETALTVCNHVDADAALYARFQGVSTLGEFDAQALKKLRCYAGAAWYARHRQLGAEAEQTFETVPEELVSAGGSLFERMLKLATYHFEDHPEHGPRLAAMNASPGHRKLANNLLGLAEIYARHPEVVSKDERHYRASDERDARKVATDIVQALAANGTPALELWTSRCAGAWTLLWNTYAEVQSLGRWLLRATPDVAAERFPSLITEARVASHTRKAPQPIVTPVPQNGETPVAPTAAAPKRRRRRSR